MLNRFRRYFTQLGTLSCDELDRSAEKLVQAEKRNVAKLIAHIAEMSRRKLALELGYKNLFTYCVERLHLSEGSVPRRMQVANAARQFPELLVALAENRLSLTVAGMLAAHVNHANVEKLLADCVGVTARQAEEYLVGLQPKPVFRPSIRRQPVRPSDTTSAKLEPPSKPVSDDATPPPLTLDPPRPPKTIVQPAEPDTFNFRFAADRRFKDKFERLAEVLGVQNTQKHMAEILEQGLDAALDKKDPKRKLERRQAKGKTAEDGRETPKTKSRAREIAKSHSLPSRYIASEVRERVFAKAGYQCEYQARDGTRCRSRTGLQIEHERPFALHHSHDETYLRAFCPGHNRFAAEQVFGSAFVRRRIDESRGDAAAASAP